MSAITKKKVVLNLTAVTEPYTLNQALKDPRWTKAMDQEIAALHHNCCNPFSGPHKNKNKINSQRRLEK